MDNVMMSTEEALPPLQNGDRSENGASVQPDVGGNVTHDDHSTTECPIHVDDEEEVLTTKDSANEETDDPQELPDVGPENPSIEALQPLQNGDRSEIGASVQTDNGGNVKHDDHSMTECLVDMDDKDEGLTTKDSENEETEDPQELPDVTPENPSTEEAHLSLQNGDRSEIGASVQPDAGENVQHDDHSSTEHPSDEDDKEEGLSAKDSPNEETADPQELPDITPKNPSTEGALLPLQNGDRSEIGASLQPDAGENVNQDDNAKTECLIDVDYKEERLTTKDSANEETEDPQELPDVTPENPSIEDTADVHSSKEGSSGTDYQVQMDDINPTFTRLPNGEDQEKKDDIADINLVTASVAASVDTTEKPNQEEEGRRLIDTAAPFESVKEAVSKFGGIVNWKAPKQQTAEKQKIVEQELGNVRDEILEYKKKSEIAEEEKLRVLKELESTKRFIEELKLNLERAETEERQAKQDAELVMLRVEEMQQGIADDMSIATKTQLEVATVRHTDAIAELKFIKEELDKTRKEYGELVKERDLAIHKSEEAVAALKEAERTVEELSIEMIAAKESLESAQALHKQAEEHGIGLAMAKEQVSLAWEMELKQAEEEIATLDSRIQAAKDLKSNLDSASVLLTELKRELAAYMESKLRQEVEEEQALSAEVMAEESEKRTCNDLHITVALAKKELKEVKLKIDKATAEVDCLKVTAASLQTELEKEKASLAAISQREGIASVTAASLEANLESVRSDIALVRTKEKEVKEKMVEQPKQLQHAAQVADQLKSLAQLAREELQKAEEEAEQAKAAASTVESRLLAAQKEIEAAKASEKLALAAIKALKESESIQNMTDAGVDSSSYVAVSVEEYYELSKRAHEAEEEATARVAAAFSQVEEAKQSDLRIQAKLEEAAKQIVMWKEKLESAEEKAEAANQGKLGVEDELRKWRAENERRRKANESNQTPAHPEWSQARSFEQSKDLETNAVATAAATPGSYFASQKLYIHESYHEREPSIDAKILKKKRSLFPRILMFLARRRPRFSKSRYTSFF